MINEFPVELTAQLLVKFLIKGYSDYTRVSNENMEYQLSAFFKVG